MDPELVISSHTRPHTDFRVRRRRYDDTTWLVLQNSWYLPDPLSDFVWLACERELTVEEMVVEMARKHDISVADALAATVYALGAFRDLGLVSWDGGAARDEG